MRYIKSVFLVIALVFTMVSSVAAMSQDTPFTGIVYNTDGEGLALKAEADINSARLSMLPDGTQLTITSITNGWGYTSINGQNGWVYLEYVDSSNYSPENDQISTSSFADSYYKYFIVQEKNGLGLDLKSSYINNSPTLDLVPGGTVVRQETRIGQWISVFYNDQFGWLDYNYLTPCDPPQSTVSNISVEDTTEYNSTEASGQNVFIYNYGPQGLPMLTSSDITSAQLATIADNTHLTLTLISSDRKWGYTSYGNQSGWILLRYTLADSGIIAEKPASYNMENKFFAVTDTDEGLELRSRADVDSTSFGPVPDDSIVMVRAIQGDWAYASYNGQDGWLNTTYLKQCAIIASVESSASDGGNIYESPDFNSHMIVSLPVNTTITIDYFANGWAHTSYNGQSCWIPLSQVRITSHLEPEGDSIIKNEIYKHVSKMSGADLRVSPTEQSAIYSVHIPFEKGVNISFESNGWGLVRFNGYTGWLHLNDLG